MFRDSRWLLVSLRLVTTLAVVVEIGAWSGQALAQEAPAADGPTGPQLPTAAPVGGDGVLTRDSQGNLVRRVTVQEEGYQLQVVAADVLSIGVLLAGTRTENHDDGGVLLAGVISCFAAAPVVHMGNGHVGRGFASFGIRSGAASVGAGVGFGIAGKCDADHEDCAFHGIGTALIGAGVGTLGAMIADAVWLAGPSTRTEDRPVGPYAPQFRAIVPTLEPQTGAVGLAVSGTL